MSRPLPWSGDGRDERAVVPQCGEGLAAAANSSVRFCSGRCRSAHWRGVRRSRARVAAIQTGQRAVCPVCVVEWTAGVEGSVGAVFCPGRCRTRAWRAGLGREDGSSQQR